MAMTNPTMVRAEREMVQQAEVYKSPYERWKEAEGLPTMRGCFVTNCFDVELAPWRSSGDGSAAIINIEGAAGFNDACVAEIPRGKSLKPHKHLFEETLYILKGRGAISVWLDATGKQTFEWHAGSYLAISMSAWHERFSVFGTEPGRYVAMTSAPRMGGKNAFCAAQAAA
jgi:mannose-6-phosphate isomerase-like protein (cupin superfamily)